MLAPKSDLTVLPADSDITVKRIGSQHEAEEEGENSNRQEKTRLNAANGSLDKSAPATKHRSLVQINQNMFEAAIDGDERPDSPPVLPPKTHTTTGKLTTRVSIGKVEKEIENLEDSNGRHLDDNFAGATVL